VPDFPDANEDPYVNTFLAKHGLHYDEIPYDAEQSPVGEHLILGISPRGGMHAVVGVDGVVKMDPHPMDGTGRGLVKPLKYGALTAVKRRAQDAMDIRAMYESAKTPMDIAAATRAYNRLMDNNEEPFSPGTMAQLKKTAQERVASSNMHQSTGKEISTNMKMYTTARRPDLFRRAKDHLHIGKNGKFIYNDALTHNFKKWAESRNVAKDALFGKRLNSAAELLRAKHDDIYNNPARFDQNKAASYCATHQAVVDLVRQAEALLSNAKLDDDPIYWQGKLRMAKDALKQAEQFAKSNDFGRAIAYQDCAFSMAHTVIDKMRKSGSSRGRDAVNEEAKLIAAVECPKKKSEDKYWTMKRAEERRKNTGARIQSDVEARRRDAAWRAQSELSSAEYALAAYRKAKAQDMLSTRQLDKYSMQSLLDTLGIDIKAFIDRPPQQRDVMLETAFNELERLGKSSEKGDSVAARAKDYSDRAQKFLREAREHWQMHSYGDCIDDCQDAIAAGADGEDLREAKQYLEACKRKGAVKATDSGIITNPTGYRPCVGDKVGGVTIESIGSDTATLSNGTRIALKFLVSTRRTGEWKIGNTRGYDATDSRRTRLHRALDAVMDSARGRAKDAVSLCKVCRQYIPNVRGVLSRHYLNGKVCSGSGAEAPEYE
jgi:hypothetical protein